MAASDTGVFWFFGLTFGVSWAIWWAIVLLDRGGIASVDALRLLKDVAAFAPSLIALAICASQSGREGVRQLLRQAVRWRIGPTWYLVALGGPLIVALAALAIFRVGGGDAAWPDSSAIIVFPLVLAVVLLLFGPLAEEFGWRGFALPRLQSRFTALQSSLLIGVAWGIWHLPLFFMTGTPQSEIPLLAYLGLIVAQSILYTWIYNSTGASLAPILLIHAAGNSWVGLIGILPGDAGSEVPFFLLTGLTWIAALAVIRFTDRKTLTASRGGLRSCNLVIQLLNVPVGEKAGRRWRTFNKSFWAGLRAGSRMTGSLTCLRSASTARRS